MKTETIKRYTIEFNPKDYTLCYVWGITNDSAVELLQVSQPETWEFMDDTEEPIVRFRYKSGYTSDPVMAYIMEHLEDCYLLTEWDALDKIVGTVSQVYQVPHLKHIMNTIWDAML